MHEPDPQVVAAACDGDLRAFEQLVRTFQGDAWRLCFQLLRDETLADDVTQDAFVRVFRFLPRYRGDSKFSTWMFSVVRNCALDELRRAGRRRRMVEQVSATPPPPHRDPATSIEVREMLGELPLELREPVVMIDMFGLSYAEVSEALRVPVGTIKSRVHRARETLARRLREDIEESGSES